MTTPPHAEKVLAVAKAAQIATLVKETNSSPRSSCSSSGRSAPSIPLISMQRG